HRTTRRYIPRTRDGDAVRAACRRPSAPGLLRCGRSRGIRSLHSPARATYARAAPDASPRIALAEAPSTHLPELFQFGAAALHRIELAEDGRRLAGDGVGDVAHHAMAFLRIGVLWRA